MNEHAFHVTHGCEICGADTARCCDAFVCYECDRIGCDDCLSGNFIGMGPQEHLGHGCDDCLEMFE